MYFPRAANKHQLIHNDPYFARHIVAPKKLERNSRILSPNTYMKRKGMKNSRLNKTELNLHNKTVDERELSVNGNNIVDTKDFKFPIVNRKNFLPNDDEPSSRPSLLDGRFLNQGDVKGMPMKKSEYVRLANRPEYEKRLTYDINEDCDVVESFPLTRKVILTDLENQLQKEKEINIDPNEINNNNNQQSTQCAGSVNGSKSNIRAPWEYNSVGQ